MDKNLLCRRRLSVYLALLGVALYSISASAQGAAATRFFTLDSVQIRFFEAGSGEAVLLIHGLGGRLEDWTTTGFVDELLSEGFRVVAYDARGHGNSSKFYQSDLYGNEDVKDALRLLDHLSIERAHVVGYSRGSKIASILVAQHPERALSVVYGGWAASSPVETLSLEDCLATVNALARSKFPEPLMRALLPAEAPLPTDEEQLIIMEQYWAANDMRALAAAFGAGCTEDPNQLLRIKPRQTPSLAIVGALDSFVPSVQAMVRQAGGAMDLQIIPDADHFTAQRNPQFLEHTLTHLKSARQE